MRMILHVAGSVAAMLLPSSAAIAEWHYKTITKTVNPSEVPGFDIDCPVGESVRGGGYALENYPSGMVTIVNSRPNPAGTAWSVGIENRSGKRSSWTVTVWADCGPQRPRPARVPPPPAPR